MTTCYTACSCNPVPHCADWGRNGLLCFGTRNAIAIYEPGAHIGRVIQTLHANIDRITTVHWIKPRNGAPETELLSTSADGRAIIWSQPANPQIQDKSFFYNGMWIADNEIRIRSVPRGDAIVFADSLQLSDTTLSYYEDYPPSVQWGKVLICTGMVTGSVKLWLSDEDRHSTYIQSISFESKLAICCRLTFLPNSECPLLAIALEDASVSLYTTNLDENSMSTGAIKSNTMFQKVQRLVGHEDWITCMDFTQDNNENLFLATCSKDSMIRLWKLSKAVKDSELSSDELKQESYSFVVNDRQYDITLESVLCGHEGWVYGVHWYPVKTDNYQTMKLLSSSIDKTMIIWEPVELMNGIWTETTRVGEVGGNSLGFYGCKFGPDGSHILAHGYQGSFHIWKYSQQMNKWLPHPTPGGHFSEVVDLCWEPKGRFLITASTDQTTRIHAPYKGDDLKELWHEIARPQIHGYDMSCLTMLAPHIYASGADEKVVRVFMATSAFRNRLQSLANVEDFKSVRAHNAAVPSLGLTNKAMYNGKNDEEKTENLEDTENLTTYEPPTEEELMQNTLWPETNKLYGHGYEIFSIAARHDGKLLATACKSTNKEHAAILLWDTDTWSQVQRLVHHQLTVTQMEFSPNNKYLLSVSRDRGWALFESTDENYQLVAACYGKDNPHTRLIWCCAWTQDSNYFATGSRDGNVVVWSPNIRKNNIVPKTVQKEWKEAVTALCFVPSHITQGSYILAIGFEKGHIEIQKVNMELSDKWDLLLSYDTDQAHHLTVKRLKFRPTNHLHNLQLASCSSDHSVKIHNIKLSLLGL
ncbi:probable elongator complex protein 2 [Monomorium pharaonis]|uniref:probable elongator complex protein 2 n=1 Tax=Monomorium pharaonis TaxID=307658 RepID=UPI00063F7A6A|nr:probable elongator complex protein 2 [Monomorium pharaonis]